ncbi:universal stress protein [Lutimaribacter sp. EGI FJ00015]|uniref:Universal stress protein n=1 Tax=Lutimaribacter degradans TaxID=2945989 RepID=A0ACC5ZW00_9RHOB|nr:universal stress protein [Lutimaribacter sp. EGI FJ00013]MCM2561729.1 universal stress protein [Lutimaribacter sp. EGI FJ00013]MCO0612558.1 universal stress protein [Lutimaribacter sp. EGI FJ00015]MCO0635217.1 universal stress protein [Lutimaribacter sp. EGI FJ00014]
MYRKILVPISFDEDRNTKSAIEVAQALSAEGAQITLLHVMEEIPGYAISYMPTDYIAESRKAVQAELSEKADALPNGQGVVVEGHSGRTIVEWAEKHGVDCIVIASHRPGMQDLLLGSTAHQVVRHSSCAVHVIR